MTLHERVAERARRPYLYIPPHLAHRWIGYHVHVDWATAAPEAHWTLEQIEEDRALLCTNKGRRLWTAVCTLQATNRGHKGRKFLEHLLRREAP